MAELDAIFKAYDIRGTVPDQLDADACRRIGAAFARFAGGPRVLLARDMRPSGVELSAAFADGVMSQGVDVVDLGMASTDLIYFAAGRLDAPAAMFTASHNPAQYNGIKLCLAGAAPVGEETGLAQVKEQAATGLPEAATRGRLSTQDLLPAYAEHVLSFVDGSAMRPLRIVADTANGMGGLVVPIVLGGLPVELELLYPELDGTFPNHPADPIQPENLKELQARVVDSGADIGLAFDGDADRVVLVDEVGAVLSGSTTTAMLAATLLDRERRTAKGEVAVVHNCICSKAVAEVIREHGGTPIRSRVGHSFIKSVMAESGALFGGEHSAHYYFRDNYRADSGLVASVIALEILSRSDVPLSEVRKPFERYAASGEINTKVPDAQAVIERVASAHTGAQQDRLDGLTVDYGDWWFNLRASNTEPLLRLNLEATTQADCDAKVREVLDLITSETES